MFSDHLERLQTKISLYQFVSGFINVTFVFLLGKVATLTGNERNKGFKVSIMAQTQVRQDQFNVTEHGSDRPTFFALGWL